MSREANDATEDLADLIEMGDEVLVGRSGETGIVDGFMAIGSDEPRFWVDVDDPNGTARSGWFRVSELSLPPKRVAAEGNVVPFVKH